MDRFKEVLIYWIKLPFHLILLCIFMPLLWLDHAIEGWGFKRKSEDVESLL